MAATSGSTYQSARLNHVANNPPNAFPQTNFETFGQYQIRMASQGLPVDITSDESDAAYLSRLGGYAPAGSTASFANVALNDVLLTYSSSAQSVNISNPVTGSYYFSVGATKLFIYNGLKWVSGSFA